MRLFQRLALGKNEGAIKPKIVAWRSIQLPLIFDWHIFLKRILQTTALKYSFCTVTHPSLLEAGHSLPKAMRRAQSFLLPFSIYPWFFRCFIDSSLPQQTKKKYIRCLNTKKKLIYFLMAEKAIYKFPQ